MAVTRPKSPKFQKTKQRPLERDYVNEAEPQIDKFATLPPRRPTTASEVQVKQPSSTRAMQLSQARRREEIVAKKEKEELAKKEDQKRKTK
jgi:hypothetical protein